MKFSKLTGRILRGPRPRNPEPLEPNEGNEGNEGNAPILVEADFASIELRLVARYPDLERLFRK